MSAPTHRQPKLNGPFFMDPRSTHPVPVSA